MMSTAVKKNNDHYLIYKEFNCLKFLPLQARGVFGSNNIPGLSVGAGDWGWWFLLGYYEHEPFLTFAEKKKEGGTKKN